MIQFPESPQSHLVRRIFLDHPESVDESYAEHFRTAMGFAFWLSIAALAAAIHSLIPALCERTASRIVCRLHDRLVSRSAQAAENQ